jgi:putative endonuclease
MTNHATPPRHTQRGTRAQAQGVQAEAVACAALQRDGWTILARRRRTASGEIDVVAEKSGLLAIIEVKHRPSLADAAAALQPRQRARLIAAAEIVLGENPDWGQNGVRFDVILVDNAGQIRRITDAFRQEN